MTTIQVTPWMPGTLKWRPVMRYLSWKRSCCWNRNPKMRIVGRSNQLILGFASLVAEVHWHPSSVINQALIAEGQRMGGNLWTLFPFHVIVVGAASAENLCCPWRRRYFMDPQSGGMLRRQSGATKSRTRNRKRRRRKYSRVQHIIRLKHIEHR
jgi:hypothetical protein